MPPSGNVSFWPSPAVHLDVYSMAGTDPKETVEEGRKMIGSLGRTRLASPNFWAAFIAALLISACDHSTESDAASVQRNDVDIAEAFVDAFYSFDSGNLAAILSDAGDSTSRILFYQGWAEGGHYEILERQPCVIESEGLIKCSITVKDDLIGALGIGLNVTDTFHLSFSGGKIIAVETSSNDPQEYFDARDWVREKRPVLIGEPCHRDRDRGPTPGDCVRAYVQGFAEFAALGSTKEDQ